MLNLESLNLPTNIKKVSQKSLNLFILPAVITAAERIFYIARLNAL